MCWEPEFIDCLLEGGPSVCFRLGVLSWQTQMADRLQGSDKVCKSYGCASPGMWVL